MERLWVLYRHVAGLRCAQVTDLARLCRVPYESLRGWWTHPKQTLCGVNEEKLARGLGGTGAAFRRVVERSAGQKDWLQRCTDLWHRSQTWLLGWLPVETLECALLPPALA